MTFKPFQQLLDPNLSSKTLQCGIKLPNLKKQLIQYFIRTYQLYEKLFTVIKNHKSYYTKPEPLRHPLIFYYGHTAAFFVNKFIDKGLINERINESYERMFAVGVDEMDWDDLNDSHYDWPTVQNARAFRQKVKNMVIQVIKRSKQTQINWKSDLWIVLMGIEHERIHLQTSSVIIRRLPIQEVNQLQWFKQCPHSIKQLIKIPVNLLKVVKSLQKNWDRQKQLSNNYGWDNQYGHKIIKTRQFSASQMLVSNGQYFEFYKDNGYSKLKYWTQQGRNWLNSTKTKKPLFWQIKYQNAQQPTYYLRTITQIIQIPWDWPVEVNNLEAQAFCQWKSQKTGKKLRLPTEDQYYAIRNLLQKDLNTWNYRQVGNINLQYWLSPNPVNMFQTKGFYDIVGNVWQHTITPIYPFEGFQIHPIYEDFTTPTFDNRHNLIKGGSFISTGNEAIYHSRYAFRRHFYQHAGFRYVESQNQPEIIMKSDIDQSDEYLLKALKVHFDQNSSYIKEVLDYVNKNVFVNQQLKSLVVGCSVGRLPLELSKKFSYSYGIDYTARFFQIATRLLQQKQLKFKDLTIDLKNFDMMQQNYNKVHLFQMNPQNTDAKKINHVSFAIIDGLSIKKNTLSKVFANCLKLYTQNKPIQILVILDKNEQHEISQILSQKFKVFRTDEMLLEGQEEKKVKLISIKGQISN